MERIAFRKPPQRVVVAPERTLQNADPLPTTASAATTYQQSSRRHVHNWWGKIFFGAQVLKPHQQPALWKKSFKKAHCHRLNTMLKHCPVNQTCERDAKPTHRQPNPGTWKVRPHPAGG
jgi:hypothetical protein